MEKLNAKDGRSDMCFSRNSNRLIPAASASCTAFMSGMIRKSLVMAMTESA